MSVFMASNTVQEEWECGLDEDGDTITLKEYKEEEGGTGANVVSSKFERSIAAQQVLFGCLMRF